MKKLFFVAVTALLTSTFNLSFAQLQWSVYSGSISDNAVPGGNEPARNLAICRCLLDGHLIPGKLVDGKCNVALGGVEHVVTKFDVLTTTGPRVIAWVKPDGSQLPNHRYIGGHDAKRHDNYYYVGRTNYKVNGKSLGIHPGRIAKVGSEYKLYFGYAGKEIETTDFEILIYKNEIKDIDGNIYATVRINNRTWMAENLRTTRLNDGQPIPVLKSDQTSAQAAMYWYQNNPKSPESKTYGALYNWAVIQKQNVCPVGWYVPSEREWQSVVGQWLKLPNQKKDGMTAAYHVRKQGNTNWSDNGSATNSTGFSALPGGRISNNGEFRNIGVQGAWWLQKDNHQTPYFFKIAGGDDGTWISEANVKDILTIRCIMN